MERGDNESQYRIGNYYHLIKQDYSNAFEWYSGSEGENVKTMYQLGYCYENGFGVLGDKEKAFELYLKSAEGGNIHAIYSVGRCYRDGIGTLKDQDKSFEWFLKAAEKGHSDSQSIVAD